MRKEIIFALFMFISTVSADEMLINWEIPLTDPAVRESTLGDYFYLTGAVNTGVPGDPALPVFPVSVLLPFGARVDMVTVESCNETLLYGSYDLKPVQHGVPISSPELFSPTPRNVASYSEPSNTPLVMPVSQGQLMGYSILDMRISPLAWNPVTGKAVLTSSISMIIQYHYEDFGCIPRGRGTEGLRVLEDIISSQVLNPEDLSLNNMPAVPADDLPWGEYLIITRDSLVSVFEPLAQFKTMKGIPAAIVTMEYIESNYSGVDAAQKLRFFLRDIYSQVPPTYVLLGGDTPLVPHRNCYATAEGYVDYPAADIYFQDMNDLSVGSDQWDANNNSIWGELSGDVMDYHPDYIIGRASVENSPQANIFVNKVLAYELPSLTDGRDAEPWFTSMGFTTGILWSNPYCPGSAGKEKVDTLYTPVLWKPVVKHYQSNGTQSYSATMEMLNMGMQLVNHAGHGSPGIVSIGTGSLGISDFMGLTNISTHGRVSIWNTIACLSGSFDTGTCLAEAWIRSPGGGGFCMMNTRYGWGEPSEPGDKWSELVDQEFFANFFTEDLYNLGVAHSMAWDEFIPLIPTDTHYDWIAKSITLFGDPELPMWSEAPDGPLQLTGPDTLSPGVNSVTVSVENNSGPVEGARVCFMQGEWNDTEMYEVDYTDASGQVQMNITADDGYDTAALTVWSRNHVLRTIEIPVSGTGVLSPDTHSGLYFISEPRPNPAINSVIFNWSTPESPAELRIFDAAGRIVKVVNMDSAETGTIIWNCTYEDGRRVPSGLYFARFITSGMDPITRQMVVINNE
ncbi:MAG: T9SS type A sorting domain-containing protein [Candidatus Aegiribacteria sp.]|nr:T9SS type A sorting domain-containing protein [Candidatus Aegiribacteria sp.]